MAQNAGMEPAGTTCKQPPAKEVDLTLVEFLELTGRIPPKEAPEVVVERRRRWLESIDPEDNPF